MPCTLGNCEEATDVVLPILEDLFEMPARGPPEGSPQWLATMKSNPHLITFQMMDKYDELMRAYIKDCEANTGRDDGFPTLLPHEETMLKREEYNHLKYKEVPRSEVLNSTRRLMEQHSNFKFMRAGGVNYSLGRMRNKGVIPYKMNPKYMPEAWGGSDGKKIWSNYSKNLRMFHAHYCYAQGITRTQDLARTLLIYLFYGKAKYLKKYVPCIAVLHKRLVTGMHRFTVEHKTKHNFAKFIDLLERRPKLKKFLTDKGKGTISHLSN